MASFGSRYLQGSGGFTIFVKTFAVPSQCLVGNDKVFACCGSNEFNISACICCDICHASFFVKNKFIGFNKIVCNFFVNVVPIKYIRGKVNCTCFCCFEGVAFSAFGIAGCTFGAELDTTFAKREDCIFACFGNFYRKGTQRLFISGSIDGNRIATDKLPVIFCNDFFYGNNFQDICAAKIRVFEVGYVCKQFNLVAYYGCTFAHIFVTNEAVCVVHAVNVDFVAIFVSNNQVAGFCGYNRTYYVVAGCAVAFEFFTQCDCFGDRNFFDFHRFVGIVGSRAVIGFRAFARSRAVVRSRAVARGRAVVGSRAVARGRAVVGSRAFIRRRAVARGRTATVYRAYIAVGGRRSGFVAASCDSCNRSRHHQSRTKHSKLFEFCHIDTSNI